MAWSHERISYDFKVMRDNIIMGFYRGVQQCAPTIGRFRHNNELQWQCWQPMVM